MTLISVEKLSKAISNNRIGEIFFWSLATLIVIISISVAVKGNIYHAELDVYLPHYLSNIPLINIVYDPLCELDITRSHSRAREIGNVFNYLDAVALLTLFKLGIPAFISVISYLCIVIVILLVYYITKITPKYNLLVSKLMVLLFLTSPPVFFAGFFYRTNKIIASVGIALMTGLLVLSVIRAGHLNRLEIFLGCLLLYLITLITALADEQGFVFALLIMIITSAYYFFFETKTKIPLLIIFIAFISAFFYKYILMEILFEKINNTKLISISSQKIDWLNFENFRKSNLLFLKYFRYLLGNISGPLLVINIFYVVLIGLYIYRCLKGVTGKVILKASFLITICFFYCAFVIHVMTLAHPAIFWDDIVSYYSLPVIMIIFLIVLLTAQYAVAYNKISHGQILLVLTLMVLANTHSLSHHYLTIINGHIKNYRHADKIIDSTYAQRTASAAIIRAIVIDSAVPGLFPDTNYGENGVAILRSKIQSAD
jgi:hypothetical protein